MRCPRRIWSRSSAEDSGRYSHHSLRSIDSRDLTRIRPFFGATNESSAHWILEHILPLCSVAFIATQKMIVKSRLPEGTEFLIGSPRWLASEREQNAIEFTFQSLDPRTQSRGASNPETRKQMNVIGHEHITPNANAKVSCATAVSDEPRVYCGIGEQICTSVSIECYKVDRCVAALKEQIQSRRLIFEHAAHGKRCNAQSSQRTSSKMRALSSAQSAVVCAVPSAFDITMRSSAGDSGRYRD